MFSSRYIFMRRCALALKSLPDRLPATATARLRISLGIASVPGLRRDRIAEDVRGIPRPLFAETRRDVFEAKIQSFSSHSGAHASIRDVISLFPLPFSLYLLSSLSPPRRTSLYLRISVSIVHRFLRKPLCVKRLQWSSNKNQRNNIRDSISRLVLVSRFHES